MTIRLSQGELGVIPDNEISLIVLHSFFAMSHVSFFLSVSNNFWFWFSLGANGFTPEGICWKLHFALYQRCPSGKLLPYPPSRLDYSSTKYQLACHILFDYPYIETIRKRVTKLPSPFYTQPTANIPNLKFQIQPNYSDISINLTKPFVKEPPATFKLLVVQTFPSHQQAIRIA